MPGNSFRTRIVILVTVLVLLVQVVSFLAVLTAINANVAADARERLERGATVFNQLVDARHGQLLQAVSVLSSDSEFKASVAGHDSATVVAALASHGERVHADLSALLTMDGEVLASTSSLLRADMSAFAGLSPTDRHMLTAGVVGETPYLFVLVPLKNPVPIAWVLMGFAIDAPLALELAQLTGLDVTVVVASTNGVGVISTLDRVGERELMPDAPGLHFEPDRYFTHSQSMPSGDGSIHVLLHRSIEAAMLPYRSLRLKLVTIASLAAFAALLVGAAMARGVTRPVERLVHAARRIRNGDYGKRVEVRDGDELGVLARTLERMQSSIADREAHIRHQATYDELTGLLNRTVARERIRSVLESANPDSTRVAVAVLGVSRFHQITESLGQPVGDEVLREVARRLDRARRAADVVARLDGEEFLVLAHDADAASARELARRLRDRLGNAVRLQQAELNLDIAVGVAVYPEHGTDVDTLIRRAGIALGDAGRDLSRVRLYEAGRDDRNLRQLHIVGELRTAVCRDELELHYQPQVALGNPGHLCVEALVRWVHPKLGRLLPGEFIELAERSGNISVLTDWVLGTAIEQIHAWRRQGVDVHVSVNLSALDVLDEHLPDRIARLLERRGVPASRLTLELTESAALEDPERCARVLQTLRTAGHRLAIDDFGTGFSSLAKLKELPVHELKIDRGFVFELREGCDDETIVRATISLAHGMGLEVTAEGVENGTGLALLSRMGCDRVQGYHISRPLGVEDATRWLLDRHRRPQPAAPRAVSAA